MRLRHLIVMPVCLLCLATSMFAQEPGWKAGTATAVITPKKPLWMAGYGSRTRPAGGALHDLWLKALVLEDAAGHQSVVLSSDTLGVPRTIYDNTCAALKAKFGLERAQIMFNCSHTHCGPVLRGALLDVYPVNDEQRAAIDEYSQALEATIVDTVSAAFDELSPAVVSAGQGESHFAVNRRNNPSADVPERIRTNSLKGPIDHAVPVLAVRSVDGSLKAVVFGYACHNTTLSVYQWCGDYAGFAQMAIEESHPGAVAMFYMGCGADQNPLPRRNVYQCRRYGQMLASAVEEVLLKPMQTLEPTLQTEFEFVELNLGDPLTRERLEEVATEKASYRHRWAARLLKQMDDGRPFVRSYRYPLQAWKLGKQQLWLSMGGEVVVDYVLGFKKQFGPQTWVAGYANDVMAYIPSLRVLEEGGYEGNTSMVVYGMPAERWATDIEDLIDAGMNRLVDKLSLPAKK